MTSIRLPHRPIVSVAAKVKPEPEADAVVTAWSTSAKAGRPVTHEESFEYFMSEPDPVLDEDYKAAEKATLAAIGDRAVSVGICGAFYHGVLEKDGTFTIVSDTGEKYTGLSSWNFIWQVKQKIRQRGGGFITRLSADLIDTMPNFPFTHLILTLGGVPIAKLLQ